MEELKQGSEVKFVFSNDRVSVYPIMGFSSINDTNNVLVINSEFCDIIYADFQKLTPKNIKKIVIKRDSENIEINGIKYVEITLNRDLAVYIKLDLSESLVIRDLE